MCSQRSSVREGPLTDRNEGMWLWQKGWCPRGGNDGRNLCERWSNSRDNFITSKERKIMFILLVFILYIYNTVFNVSTKKNFQRSWNTHNFFLSLCMIPLVWKASTALYLLFYPSLKSLLIFVLEKSGWEEDWFMRGFRHLRWWGLFIRHTAQQEVSVFQFMAHPWK